MIKQLKQSKPPNGWEVRPSAPRGDQDSRFLFASIGEALTEWERVESSCAEIFAVLVSARVKSAFWAPAIQAYGSVISVKGRCEMVHLAASAYFQSRKQKQEKFEKRLGGLVNEVRNYSDRRNEIAHGQVTEIHHYEPGLDVKSMGYYLYPSLYNPKKFKRGTGPTFMYMSSDIIHYRQEFAKLHLRLEGLRHELLGGATASPIGSQF